MMSKSKIEAIVKEFGFEREEPDMTDMLAFKQRGAIIRLLAELVKETQSIRLWDS